MADTGSCQKLDGPNQGPGPPSPKSPSPSDGDVLDPRIQEELERLNKASNDINKLECSLDEARAYFRQLLTESTQRLDVLAKKLGQCIEKARPYYEARMKAKESQIETQKAALRFERACSQQAAAKEMVNLAEQGFFKRGQPFDPAWQEMLNHATIKVNEAEQERLESEIEHKQTAQLFNEAEQRVKLLQKDLKRNIAKSKSYFETKAQFNQAMEEQKNHVGMLEKRITKAKFAYSEALRCLESISDQIHQQRQDARARKELGWRRPGVGAEAPTPPPERHMAPHAPLATPEPSHINHQDSYIESPVKATDVNQISVEISQVGDNLEKGLRIEDSFCAKHNTQVSDPADGHSVNSQSKRDVEGGSSSVDGAVSQSAIRQPEPQDDIHKQTAVENDKLNATDEPNSGKSQEVENSADSKDSDVVMRPPSGIRRDSTSRVGRRVTPRISVLESSADELACQQQNTADQEHVKDNAEIMQNIQKAKEGLRGFLHPRQSSDDLLENMSDTDSICESINSGIMLDDQQIENLMLETTDYATVLDSVSQDEEWQDEDYRRNSLPPNLSYLENYLNIVPSQQSTAKTSLSQSSETDNDVFKGERSEGSGSSSTGNKNDIVERDNSTGVDTHTDSDCQRSEGSQGQGQKGQQASQTDTTDGSVSPIDQEVEFTKSKGFRIPIKSDEELEYFV